MMVHDSPLRKRHSRYQQARQPDPQAVSRRPGAARGAQAAPAEVEYIRYGPPGEAEGTPCELVATFGDIEAEYAAIRKGAGLLDCPHRATLAVSGQERRDFLDRMVTQVLKGVGAGGVRETFWLNRKGRIDADLLLIELGDRMLIDVDIHRAGHVVRSLREFLFTEDVEIGDVTGSFHHIAVHGPVAAEAVTAAAGLEPEPDPENLTARVVRIAGAEVVAARRDLAGEVGLELIVAVREAEAVWDALLDADETVGKGKRRIRPVGWHAFNIARIEAGTPLFDIDFGTANLPHETGLLERRVSFAKGCYLGQEIVARTHHLGRPKQLIVGLRPRRGLLPAAGSPVYAAGPGGESPGAQVGVVTSSTLSPMLGSAPIALGMLRSSHAEPGTVVILEAEGEQIEAAVQRPGFLPGRDGKDGA